jgi:hypothetical protein
MPPNRISILVAREVSDEGLKRVADILITVRVYQLVLQMLLDVPRLVGLIEDSVPPGFVLDFQRVTGSGTLFAKRSFGQRGIRPHD